MSDELPLALESVAGPVPPPGEYIRAELEQRGWGQAELARIVGRPLPTISEIIQGKRAILPEMAVALGAAFGTGDLIWLQRESAYRLSLVDQSDPETRARARLFGLAPGQGHGAAWLDRPNAAGPRAGRGIVPLFPSPFAWGLAPAGGFGAPAALERGLHRGAARLDGAAFWLSADQPVIALSVRHDRIDWFWHTLAHKLIHVRHGEQRSVDASLVGESRVEPLNEVEARAEREGAPSPQAARGLLARDLSEALRPQKHDDEVLLYWSGV